MLDPLFIIKTLILISKLSIIPLIIRYIIKRGYYMINEFAKSLIPSKIQKHNNIRFPYII